MFGSILNQIADIFKSSKGKGDDHGGNFDLLRFWLEYQQIKEQWQELHYLLHHGSDLRGGGKGIRLVNRGKKGVDISGEQTCTHSRKAEQEKFCLPLSHTQSSNQQRRGHTDQNIFNIGHLTTAFPVAGNRASRQSVSRKSNQQ